MRDLKIDKKSRRLDGKKYYKTKYTKTQIILGSTNRYDNFYYLNQKSKIGGGSKDSNAYTISREGIIYEHFDPKYYTDFMGDKSIDKGSISVMLENMGGLTYNFLTDTYRNWENKDCDDNLKYEKRSKGFQYWESYTEKQIKSTFDLSRYLLDEFSIENSCIGNNKIVASDSIEFFNGVVCRSNYSVDYLDLNDSFDFRELMNVIEI